MVEFIVYLLEYGQSLFLPSDYWAKQAMLDVCSDKSEQMRAPILGLPGKRRSTMGGQGVQVPQNSKERSKH